MIAFYATGAVDNVAHPQGVPGFSTDYRLIVAKE
jgi:hypothetical protein